MQSLYCLFMLFMWMYQNVYYLTHFFLPYKRLCKYLEAKELQNAAQEKYTPASMDANQKKEMENLERTIDEIKQSLIDSNLVIRKGTSGITVKIPQI